MKVQKNKEIGITLIALVITIIVLLILAGVSIATLTGENGILIQANTAKEATKKKETIERAQLDILGVQSENYGKITKEQFREILVKYFEEDSIPALEDLPDDMSTATQTLTVKEEYGSYEIKISDIWNGEFSKKEVIVKTASELYDGINDENNANYNENAMHIGDWVNYTAGNWEKTVTTPAEDFEFGGYNAGQSRDTNAIGEYTGARESATYEGWRIWDIDKENGTMTLVSAGCPEEYYHPYGDNYAYISEYILAGNINASADADSLGLGETYKPRDWSIYKNTAQYAKNARALTKGDLDTWYGKYIDSSITDTWNVSSFPANDTNKLISTVKNQCYYWISFAGSEQRSDTRNP